MTTVSHILGDVTRWEHVPGSYAELNDAFLNGGAGADLNRLCGLATQTPIVLGFVTSDDPMYVTFAHSPQRYPALGHHYDDQFFAFVGNDRDSTMALRLRVPETTDQVDFRTLSVANHHAATSAAGAPLFQPRRDRAVAAAAGQQDFFEVLSPYPYRPPALRSRSHGSWPALLRSLPRHLHPAIQDRGEFPE